MSSFLAKFRVTTLEDARYAPEGSVSVTMQGVQGEPFGSATPSAYLTMTIHNREVADILKAKYAKYLAAIKAHRDAMDAGTLDRMASYPAQPEFLVMFTPDNEAL